MDIRCAVLGHDHGGAEIALAFFGLPDDEPKRCLRCRRWFDPQGRAAADPDADPAS